MLAEAGESVAKFLGSGLAELGPKLGPILWQFMPTKRFEPEDFGAFLHLLPDAVAGVRLRHALEVRHESFRDPAFVAMAQARGAAIVFADSAKHPCIPDLTADFVYARMQDAKEDVETGYAAADLDRFRDMAEAWSRGEAPASADFVSPPAGRPDGREVCVFMITGAKGRAPAAAQALLARL